MTMTINGTSGLVFNDASTQATAATGFGFKNRIINGAMMIDQRNAGASVTPTTGTYTVDRWRVYASQTSKLTAQQNAGSVTPPAGFINYLGITSSSAYSVTSSDLFLLQQFVEGFNVADLNWGTANAQAITISFWVRSSLTGTFGVTLQNSAGDRVYPFTYTINVANTWEQKSVTIAGDTTGTWLTNNGKGIVLSFGLGVGSSASGTAGSWQAAGYYGVTGATSVVGTSGATFYITGVQLEKGSTATSFDYRPYGTELALCQRYFERSYDIGTATGATTTTGMNGWYGVQGATTTGEIGSYATFMVSKRATPTIVTYDSAGTSGKARRVNAGVASYNDATFTMATVSQNGFSAYSPSFGNSTTGVIYHFTASAEL